MSERICSPTCEFFKCGRNSKFYRDKKIWCNFTNEECDVLRCAYVQCIRNKLLSNNICGLTIKRKTVDQSRLEDFKLNVKIKGKFAKRLGDEEDLI